MDTRKQVIAKVVENFPGGKESAAAFLGMSISSSTIISMSRKRAHSTTARLKR